MITATHTSMGTRITSMTSKRQHRIPLGTSLLKGEVGSRTPRVGGCAGNPNSAGNSVPPHPTPIAVGERENAAARPELAAARREFATHPAQDAGCDRAGGVTVSHSSLYRLLAWLSPAYPVGAFSYSSGLEWAVEAGDIQNAETLFAWLAVMIGEGSGFCDAVLFVHAYRAVAAGDEQALRSVVELAAAFAASKERHLETTAQGAAFLDVTRAAWPCAALERLIEIWPGPYAYPVAVATAAAGHCVAVEPALAAYLQAITANLVSAAVRLVPLGQTDGQRVIAATETLIVETARRAMVTSLEEMGSAAFRADIASQRHETQYTRLFRS